MEINKVCVLGGSGFVGRHLVSKLHELGYSVSVPYRNINHAKHLSVLPTVTLVEADIHDPAALKSLFQGMDAVINLVGILHEGKRGAFQRAHVDLPRKVVETCRATGVKRLLHMSAIGVGVADGLSRYQRSKGEGEAIVREAHGEHLAVTVFRPLGDFRPGGQLSQPVRPPALFDANFPTRQPECQDATGVCRRCGPCVCQQPEQPGYLRPAL